MLKQILTFLGCAALSCAVLAQQGATPQPKRIGKTAEVKGLVTVSDGASVNSVGNNSAIVNETRYVTGSNGTVLLRMDNGCDVRLQPSQSLVVRDEDDCPALWAAIQNLSDRVLVGYMPGSSGLLLLGGAVGGAIVLRNVGSNRPISGQ